MDYTAYIAVITLAAAISATVVALTQYRLQAKVQRASFFYRMRRRFKESDQFENISALLETDHADLRTISFSDKRAYLGFLEEIALLMNSSIIKPEVVHYMFGNYVTKCWKSSNFWICEHERLRIEKSRPYWALFANLVDQIQCLNTTEAFIHAGDNPQVENEKDKSARQRFCNNLNYDEVPFFDKVKRFNRKKKLSESTDIDQVISMTTPLPESYFTKEY